MTGLGGSCLARCRVLPLGRVWRAVVLVLVALGVWVGSARAVTYTQQTLSFGLRQPLGVAVDGGGDVFVTNPNSVVELPAGGSQRTLQTTGLSGPEGVAVDAAGDVFVADTLNNRVVELPAGGSQQTLPFSGLNQPEGVAVDLAGNVFVADTGHSRVVELSPSLTSGSFVLSPVSARAGSSVGLASVAPCTLRSGGAFAATEAKLFLYSSTG